MTKYNIYFGPYVNIKYQYTMNFKDEESANNHAQKAAEAYYYKNEGKHGLPDFSQIYKESKITGVNLESLYKEHIEDMLRWYAIPTDVDTISKRKLIYI